MGVINMTKLKGHWVEVDIPAKDLREKAYNTVITTWEKTKLISYLTFLYRY